MQLICDSLKNMQEFYVYAARKERETDDYIYYSFVLFAVVVMVVLIVCYCK